MVIKSQRGKQFIQIQLDLHEHDAQFRCRKKMWKQWKLFFLWEFMFLEKFKREREREGEIGNKNRTKKPPPGYGWADAQQIIHST